MRSGGIGVSVVWECMRSGGIGVSVAWECMHSGGRGVSVVWECMRSGGIGVSVVWECMCSGGIGVSVWYVCAYSAKVCLQCSIMSHGNGSYVGMMRKNMADHTLVLTVFSLKTYAYTYVHGNMEKCPWCDHVMYMYYILCPILSDLVIADNRVTFKH